MTTKTNGAEFKRFLNDDSFWLPEEEAYYEDEIIIVDGTQVPDYDFAPDSISDTAKVSIEGGAVFSKAWDKESAPSFEGYFKKWRKLQSSATMVIEFPKEKLASVKAALKAAGAKEHKV